MTQRDQKPLLHWMGRMLIRFVGLVFILYGLLLLVGNIVDMAQDEVDAPWWAIGWVLASGLAALAGGLIYILSFDGPAHWTTGFRRGTGIGLMMLSALLPTTVGSIVLVFAVLTIPSIWVRTPKTGTATDG